MRHQRPTILPPKTALALFAAVALAACATTGLPPGVPDDAAAAIHTEANGDVITEYRVAGQLRAVKVVPFRGPTYYLYDRDGDGRVDPMQGDAPVTYFKLFSW